jgi:hypothetical protein
MTGITCSLLWEILINVVLHDIKKGQGLKGWYSSIRCHLHISEDSEGQRLIVLSHTVQ